jgi:hypothetical protein
VLATDHVAPTNLCHGVGEYRVGQGKRPWFLHSAASALGAYARAAGLLFVRAEASGQPLDAHTGVDPGQTRCQLASHHILVRRLRCDGVFG